MGQITDKKFPEEDTHVQAVFSLSQFWPMKQGKGTKEIKN